MAECPRTFPSVTFPAGTFLKCAEIETGKTADGSVNRPMRHAYGSPGQAHLTGPIDVLYGYRGRAYNVDLHSPFEMMRFWKPVKITAWCGSRLTSAGVKYRDKCRVEGEPPRFRAGEHYVADLKARSWATDTDRILLPDLPATGGNRNRWCWERRGRPYVPCWDYGKVPNKKYSTEEHSRMLCVYMRPWCLNIDDVATHNPLLSKLAIIMTMAPRWHQGTIAPRVLKKN